MKKNLAWMLLKYLKNLARYISENNFVGAK